MSMEEFTQALDGMDPAELALGAGFAGAVAMMLIFGAILWFFISAIGFRKMFMKAGESGWKAFIPYYSEFIRFKLGWKTKFFWPYLVTLLVVQYVHTEEPLAVAILGFVCLVVCFVLGLKGDINLAKAFGKSTGWGVLLFFFPFIVSLILGFGKAEYVGNTTV